MQSLFIVHWMGKRQKPSTHTRPGSVQSLVIRHGVLGWQKPMRQRSSARQFASVVQAGGGKT